MEVILRENYPSLGYVGDIVDVRRGYARNFLLPKGIALELTKRNAKALNHQLAAINAKRAKIKAEAEVRAKTLEGLTLEFPLKTGKDGRLFGSVTAREIERMMAEKGIVVDKKQIKLNEPIKKAGTKEISVKLHSEVAVTVKIVVIAESSEETSKKEAAAVEEAPKSNRRSKGSWKDRAPRSSAEKNTGKTEEEKAH